MNKHQEENESIYQKILKDLPRTKDHEASESEFIEKLAAKIKVDFFAIRKHLAKEMINSHTKLGSTGPSSEQLVFQDGSFKDWEPKLLIRGDKGRVVENLKASPITKSVDARRSVKNALAVARTAEQKVEESNRFNPWAKIQMDAGRPRSEITFGNFVRETRMLIKKPLTANG
jgi:hypothetical protein